MNTRILFIGILLALGAVSCGGKKQTSSTASTTPVQESVEFQELFFEGQRAKATGDYAKAFGFFEQAAEISPSNDAVYYEMGRVQRKLEAPLIALDYARKATELDPTNAWYHALEADLYRELGRKENLEAALQRVIEADPSMEDSYYRLVEVQFSLNAPKRALKTLELHEQNLGPNPDVYRNRANVYMHLDEADKATKALETLVETYPQSPEYQLILAEHYAAIGQPDKASAVFDRVGQMDSDNGELHLRLSEFYAAQGQDEKSFDALVKAFKSDDLGIDPKVGVMMRFYSLTELNPDYVSKAYQLLDLLREAHPSEAKAHAMAGDFLIRDGALKEAQSAYDKAVELDGSKDAIWQQLTGLDLELGDMPALKQHAEAAADRFPVSPNYYLYAGIANLELGDAPAAIKHLKSGRLLVLENPAVTNQFWIKLGDAYHANEQHEESDKAYEQSLKIDGDNVFVLNNYAYYLSLRGEKLDRAEDLSQRCNDLEPNQPSFMDTMGWVYFKQGNYEEAIEWLSKANDLTSGKVGEILEHLGDAHAGAGNASEAMEFWQKAAETGDGSEALPQKLETGKLGE